MARKAKDNTVGEEIKVQEGAENTVVKLKTKCEILRNIMGYKLGQVVELTEEEKQAFGTEYYKEV